MQNTQLTPQGSGGVYSVSFHSWRKGTKTLTSEEVASVNLYVGICPRIYFIPLCTRIGNK